MRKKLLALAAILTVGFAIPASAHGPDAPWAGSDPIPVYLYAPDTGGVAVDNPLNKGAATQSALNAAIAAWNNQPSRYRFVNSGTTSTLPAVNDGRVVIRYVPSMGNAGIGVTVREVCQPLTQYACSADIQFNDFYYDLPTGRYVYWNVNGTKVRSNQTYWIDFQYALTHELGHVLAQTHIATASCNSSISLRETMCLTAGGFMNTYYGRTLQAHDVDWINTVQ
jgi:hypothetical protein